MKTKQGGERIVPPLRWTIKSVSFFIAKMKRSKQVEFHRLQPSKKN